MLYVSSKVWPYLQQIKRLVGVTVPFKRGRRLLGLRADLSLLESREGATSGLIFHRQSTQVWQSNKVLDFRLFQGRHLQKLDFLSSKLALKLWSKKNEALTRQKGEFDICISLKFQFWHGRWPSHSIWTYRPYKASSKAHRLQNIAKGTRDPRFDKVTAQTSYAVIPWKLWTEITRYGCDTERNSCQAVPLLSPVTHPSPILSSKSTSTVFVFFGVFFI